MSKQAQYASLVAERKDCTACAGLVNPAKYGAGMFDADHIGPWSRWQGHLDSAVMVIGQDWGDTRYFEANEGHEARGNPTNSALAQLMASIGIEVGAAGRRDNPQVAFLTNAILCLKGGGLQGAVRVEWFRNCSYFLRRQVEIVSPRVVVTLGEKAFRALISAFAIRACGFREAVEGRNGISLPNGSLLVPVYHCGRRIQNTHRPFEQQIKDWQRVGRALRS